MSRFAATFVALRERGELALLPYLTAGFPDVGTSEALARAALEAGADGFEIGVPFSDPLADGATQQRANARALEGGATLDTALSLARFIRSAAPDVPIALMSYFNPLLRRGERGIADALAAAGADGLIVPDLPTEESRELDAALRARGLDLVPLLAPTSGDERVRLVAGGARGFVYCVSLVGVTGARQAMSDALGPFLARVRAATSAPLVVGFGISQPEHVQNLASLGADGAIVASALTDLVERGGDVSVVRSYLRDMKTATVKGGSMAGVGARSAGAP